MGAKGNKIGILAILVFAGFTTQLRAQLKDYPIQPVDFTQVHVHDALIAMIQKVVETTNCICFFLKLAMREK